MNRYQLAKLITMAGGLKSRKRIQKTVHLLQATGCDFGLDFRLHYYGPYSFELADLLNQMTATGILTETTESTAVGTQYDYELSPDYAASFEQYERTPRGAQLKRSLEAHQAVLARLGSVAPRVLELASTIAEFYHRKQSWDDATEMAACFKGEASDSPNMLEARELAEELMGMPDGED